MTKAYHSENLVYYLGRFAANKVDFTWFVTLILELDASTFRWVKGACSVIPFKGACAIKLGAPLSAGIWYNGKEYLARVAASLSEPSWLLPSFFEQFKE